MPQAREDKDGLANWLEEVLARECESGRENGEGVPRPCSDDGGLQKHPVVISSQEDEGWGNGAEAEGDGMKA